MGQLRKLRKNNIVCVLNALYELGSSSKKKLAEYLGFSTALMTNICNDLAAEGIISEGKSLKSSKAGRREVLIDINFDHKLIAGITLLKPETTIVISNLKPEIKFKKTIRTDGENIVQFLGRVINVVNDYISDNKLDAASFLGIGIGVMGGINIDTGLMSKELWNKNVDLRGILTEFTELPLFFQNDTNNLAMAEHFFSHEKQNFVVICHDSGVGGAIFKDGRLLLNTENTTGKIGHMIVNPEGGYCPNCKRRGCLESMTSLSTIYREIAAGMQAGIFPYLKEQTAGNPEKLNRDLLFAAYRDGSIDLSVIFKRCARYFAQAIISSYSVLGIKDYILHGYFFEQPEFFQLVQFYIQDLQCCIGAPTIALGKVSANETDLSSAVLVLYNTFLKSDE